MKTRLTSLATLLCAFGAWGETGTLSRFYDYQVDVICIMTAPVPSEENSVGLRFRRWAHLTVRLQ